MAHKTMPVEIVTPHRRVFKEQTGMIITRTTEGDIGILPGHTPLIAALVPWVLLAKTGNEERRFAVGGGFLQVSEQGTIILAETAEAAEEIDVDRARAAKARAQERLQRQEDDRIDFARARSALEKALARLRAVGEE